MDIIRRKPIIWLGNSREGVSAFPGDARRRAGFELWTVQQGGEPSDFKPMPTVGIGVYEIRIRLDGAFRVIYVAKYPEAIYVVHAFHKKTQQTAAGDIDLARKRLRDLVGTRRSK